MKRFIRVLGVFLIVLYFNVSHGQKSKFALSSQLSATRFYVDHNLGLEVEGNRFRFGGFIGYSPLQLLRYGHFSSHFKLSGHIKLVGLNKISIYTSMDFLSAFNVVSSNPTLRVFSLFGGYGLTYGNRLQLVQTLSLGASQLRANELKPYWVHDFQITLGVRYFLKKQDV
jgi:hypothetical protein